MKRGLSAEQIMRYGYKSTPVFGFDKIVSSIMGRDYKAEKARTLDTLGLDGYTMEEMLKIL